MTEIIQFFAVLLAAVGLVSLGWLALGALLLPGRCDARLTVSARGGGEGLEQTVKGLLWLRRTGLLRGEVIIEDCGLDRDGLALARALAEQHGVTFSGDAPDRIGTQARTALSASGKLIDDQGDHGQDQIHPAGQQQTH